MAKKRMSNGTRDKDGADAGAPKAAGSRATTQPWWRGITKARPLGFNTQEHAGTCAARSGLWIVLGNCDGEVGEYLVVPPADATRLERAGYELLR